MDNIFEILVPLVIAAVYFFGNMFSGKSEDDAAPPTLPRQRGADEDSDEVDAIERQRRVQAEILRKIMERRRGSGNTPPSVAPVGSDMRHRRGDADMARKTPAAQKQTRDAVHETRDRRSSEREARRDLSNETTPSAFSWDQSDNAYDSGMEAQLKRIEVTKREAEKLQKQAVSRRKTNLSEEQPQQQTTGGYFSGTVRESLLDPQAARVAFIYGEVLGPPVALRKGPGTIPGLN